MSSVAVPAGWRPSVRAASVQGSAPSCSCCSRAKFDPAVSIRAESWFAETDGNTRATAMLPMARITSATRVSTSVSPGSGFRFMNGSPIPFLVVEDLARHLDRDRAPHSVVPDEPDVHRLRGAAVRRQIAPDEGAAPGLRDAFRKPPARDDGPGDVVHVIGVAGRDGGAEKALHTPGHDAG